MIYKASTPSSILEFWFSEPTKKYWFKSTPEFDSEIRRRFEYTWQSAINYKLEDWKQTAHGALALIILLDQFPLHMFRGKAKSYSSEKQAIETARYAIKEKYDEEIATSMLQFLYMPFMHSESIEDQNLSLNLFEKAGLKKNIRYAKHHREIIIKFGRFPHRNKALNRNSTEEEISYLNSPHAFTG